MTLLRTSDAISAFDSTRKRTMHKVIRFILAIMVFATFAGEAQARRRAVTAASAYLHGTADVIRAEGRAARNISRARINNEEARSRYIDNQLKWTETYFAKKAIYAAYVAKESAKRKESVQNYLKNRPSGAPPRLGLSDFDPSTGEITWPDSLQTSEFNAPRKQVESLFALRANVHAAPGIVTDIRNAVETLRAELRKQIVHMAPSEYIVCRKFLDSLAYEGTLPSG